MNIAVDDTFRAIWLPSSQTFLLGAGETSAATARVGGDVEAFGEITGGEPPYIIASMGFVGGPPAAGISITQTTTTVPGDTIAITADPLADTATYGGIIRATVIDSSTQVRAITIDLPYIITVQVTNQLEEFYINNSAHAWWLMREIIEPYIDGGGNYDMYPVQPNSVPWNLPGLTRGSPRQGGLHTADAFSVVGTVKATGGPSAAGWTTGGLTALVLLGKTPTPSNQFVVYQTYYTDTSLDAIRLEVTSTQIELFIEAGASFVRAETDLLSVPINEPFSVAVMQPADGNGVTFFINGIAVNTTHTFSAGLDIDSWMDDVFTDDGADPNAVETLLGHSLNFRGNRGIMSAPAVYRNNVLTAGQVTAFHDSCNIDGKSSDWGEYVIEKYADARMGLFPIGGIFQVVNPMFSFGTNAEPQAVASNPNMIFGDNRIVTDYNLDAFRFDSPSFEPRLREATVTSGEMGPDGSETEGTLICVFQVLSVLAADDPQYIFGWGASDILDSATWAGMGAYLEGDDSDATLFVYWRVNANKSVFRINNVGDFTTGDFVMLTIQQPDDGGGPLFWVNDVAATATDVDTEGAGIIDEWFADLFTGYPGTPGWAWGSDQFDQRFRGYGHALLVTNEVYIQNDIDTHWAHLTGVTGASGHVGTFDEAVDNLNAEFDYIFDEAAGAVVNHGSAIGENLGQITAPSARQVPNEDYSVTDGLMATLVASQGWGEEKSLDSDWDLATGTFIVAFNQTGAPTPEDYAFIIQSDAGTFTVRVGIDGSNNIFFSCFGTGATNGGKISGPTWSQSGVASGMFLVAVIQRGDGAGPELFVNGRSYGKGDFLANGEPDFWFTDIRSSATSVGIGGRVAIGGASLTQGLSGDMDRVVLSSTIATPAELVRMAQKYGTR